VSSKPESPLKKPFQKPVLRIYGTMQDLTGSVGMGMTKDSQASSKTT
jgi:hypothetical protein